jgi:hypothetical protein
MPDMAKLLDEAAGISGNMKANFGGSVSALASAVYQAKLMGLELGQMEGVSNNLLDFQSSIENEMKAELLLGKNLNLEKAREFALMGDTKNLMKEITKQAGSQKDFLKMNIPQRKALAAAIGMEVNELADKFDKQAKMDALAKENAKILNKLRTEGNLILGDGFDIKKASLQEIRVAAEAAGTAEEEIIKLLGKENYARMETEDATQKFNKALDQAKEALIRLVDGGALNKLADILTGLTESALFSGFAEEGNILNAQNNEKKITDKDSFKNLTKEQQTQIKDISTTAQKEIPGFFDRALDKAIAFGLGSFIPGGQLVAGIIADGQNDKEENDILAARKAIEAGANDITSLTNPAKIENDFILRPGQAPVSFNKGDLLMGGTNLGGGGGGNTEAILGRILAAIETGGDVYMDGDKVGKSLALATSRMG